MKNNLAQNSNFVELGAKFSFFRKIHKLNPKRKTRKPKREILDKKCNFKL